MENIKKLYSQVLDKKAFVKLCANEFSTNENNIETNWLSTGRVPNLAKKRMHTLLINTLKCQIDKTKDMIL